MATITGWRKIWQLPRAATDPTEREVSFLELFYDLVFVVIIAQVSHELSRHPTWTGLGWYLFTLVPVWQAWMNGAIYHDMHGPNDISTRVFTFAQMITVGGMAIYVHGVSEGDSDGFAIAFAVNQIIQAGMWFRTGMHDREHRRDSTPYSILQFLCAGIFIGAVFVVAPLKFYLWIGALALQFLAPFFNILFSSRFREIAEQIITPSLVERFGLFVIIVLGEVVVGTITGVANHESVDLHVGGVGLLGALLAIGLWFIYFDLVARRLPRTSALAGYLGLHFVAIAAIAAVGASVLNAVEHAGALPGNVRWLLIGSTMTATVSVGILMRLVRKGWMDPIRRKMSWLVFASVGPMIGLGFLGLEAKPTLAVLVALLLFPVLVGIVQWSRIPIDAQTRLEITGDPLPDSPPNEAG